jgi:biotin operon repressor
VTLLDALTAEPQTKRELAEKVGLPTREVEALIQSYRLDGVWIVSDSRGYRYAATVEEMQDCARRLRERAIHQLLTARALRRSARDFKTVEMVLGL